MPTSCSRLSATTLASAYTPWVRCPRYRRRHADHVLATVFKAAAALHEPDAPAAVMVLDRLLPELRAAREHLQAPGDVDAVLQLTTARSGATSARSTPKRSSQRA
jgi:hypothetical protein